jgi:hypothetical protein
MKTEDILNLDCTKGNNLEQINKFLWKVKPVARILEKNNYTKTEQAPLELLEQALHGIMLRYGYRTQGIDSYYEELGDKGKRFVFYTVSVLKTRETSEWIGNVYGKTMWETVAKIIIKVYADLKKEKAEQ